MGNATRIAELNDQFRTSMIGGRVVVTPGVYGLPFADVLDAVRRFRDFSPGDNPYGERDFGAFDICGEKLFWKIDYYNRTLDAGSEDPSDPEQTTRVLTIMLASEY